MAKLTFFDHSYTVDDYDTVLNTLLKNGHAVPNACRGGHCHSCLMKAEEGSPMPFSQMGLAPELVDEGYFLACQCMIYADIKVTTPERQKRTRFTAMVEEKTQLSDQILRLRLKPARDFAYKSGQYLTLINIDGYYADYPVASVHGADNLMEFHINTESEQELDRYISEQLEENDALEVQTAFAHHHYRSEERDKDLLLIARDEAIAGAFGLLREALHNEHSGTIHLIHLCEQLNTPYLAQALTELGTEQPAISCETLPANDSQALTARLESIKDSNNHCCFLWSNNTSDKLDIQEVANSLLNPRQLTVIKP